MTRRLFAPASIAVVGASPDATKIGSVLLRNLAGFAGAVHPVHPSAAEVAGRKAYATVSAIPGGVDLALLAIPPQAVPGALEDCGRAGVGGAVVYSGGWAETGAGGAARQWTLLAEARRHGIRLLGPNTSGFLAPAAGLYATFVADLPGSVTTGPLAIVAQSGGVNLNLCFLAASEGLGVSLAVGLGNACDVTFADVLDHLAGDGGTGPVLLAIEGIADGRGLVAAVERVAARRPVVALKLGRSDVSSFAKSHTGALTGSYRVTRAALTQAGAVVVDDVTELMDAAVAFAALRLRPNAQPGVAVVTAQAGTGLLLADALASRGVAMPALPPPTRARLAELLPPLTYQANPVDTGRPGPSFADVMRAVSEAPGIELVAVSLLHEPDAVDPAVAFAGVGPAVLATQGPASAIAALRDRLRPNGVPLRGTPDAAARAVSALVRDARQSAAREAREGREPAPVPALGPARGRWDEHEAKSLLEAVGFMAPQRVVCATRDEAHAALRRLGRIAAKALHPELAHKTEAGGVHLGLATPAQLEAALDAIDRIAGARYLIEAMAEPGPELLLGARRDPAFGPIVVLGTGGLGAEGEDDLAVRLAPVTQREARGLLSELRGAWRYRGHRGGPAVDEDALGRALAALAALLAGRDDIAEIEINPLRVTAAGLVMLDALVVGA